MQNYVQLKSIIRRRDRYRCVYCGRRDQFGEFHLDHFYPTLTNDLENVFLACPLCNRAKGPLDPTNLILHPKKEQLAKHIEETESGMLLGKTEIGRSTIENLQLNRLALISWRQQERKLLKNINSIVSRIASLKQALEDDSTLSQNTDDESALILDLYWRLQSLSAPPELFDHGEPVRVEVVDWGQVGRELTPFVMTYLGNNPGDLDTIDPQLFEQVIAEYFASVGCDVTLLGQNPNTGADILAIRTDDSVGVEIRYMIEVKRWKERVGIEVVDRVLGAFTREKPDLGWDKMLIVSKSGFKNFRGTDKERLSRLGIHLKGKDEIQAYLKNYTPRPDGGLWLPGGWKFSGGP